MAINKKLLFFKKKQSFNDAIKNNQILDQSIVYVKDKKPFIYTHKVKFPTYSPIVYTITESINWNSFNNQTITELDLSQILWEDFININNENCKILFISDDSIAIINKEGKIAKITNSTFTVQKSVGDKAQENINNLELNKVQVNSNIDKTPTGCFLISNEDLSNDEFTTQDTTAAVSPIYLAYKNNKEAEIYADTSVASSVYVAPDNLYIRNIGTNSMISFDTKGNECYLLSKHTTEDAGVITYKYLLPRTAGTGDVRINTLALKTDIPPVKNLNIFSSAINLNKTTLTASGEYSKRLAESLFSYAEDLTNDKAFSFTITRDSDIQKITTKNVFVTTKNETSPSKLDVDINKIISFTFYMPIPINTGSTTVNYENRQFTLCIMKYTTNTLVEGGSTQIAYKYAVASETKAGQNDSFKNAITLFV